VLGNLLDLAGFEYMSSDEIREELRQQVGEKRPNNRLAWKIPSSLSAPAAVKGLQRITEMPIYSTDALVRRASSLQKTVDATMASGIHIHPQLASLKNLSQGNSARVKQNGATITLPVVLDERVPQDGVLIYAGQLANLELGEWYGGVEVSAA
jgi:NADH-quinone oxidoreductase subunit G